VIPMGYARDLAQAAATRVAEVSSVIRVKYRRRAAGLKGIGGVFSAKPFSPQTAALLIHTHPRNKNSRFASEFLGKRHFTFTYTLLSSILLRLSTVNTVVEG
jgi:hypothetical protein